MSIETANLFKKIIRQLLRATILSNVVIAVALLFISIVPQFAYLYFITVITTTFIIGPLFFILLIYVIYKKRRKEIWLGPIKKEVTLLIFAILSFIFYYVCLYIGTEII